MSEKLASVILKILTTIKKMVECSREFLLSYTFWKLLIKISPCAESHSCILLLKYRPEVKQVTRRAEMV
jgi:hypothetical protein